MKIKKKRKAKKKNRKQLPKSVQETVLREFLIFRTCFRHALQNQQHDLIFKYTAAAG